MTRIILLLFSFFIEAVVFYQYAFFLFIPKHSFFQRLLLLSLLYTSLFFSSIFGIVWINLTLFFLANFLFLYTQYRLTLLSAIFHSAMLSVIMGVTESVAFAFTPLPTMLKKDEAFIPFVIFSKALYFLIVVLMAHITRLKSGKQTKHNDSTLLLLLIPTSSVFILLSLLMYIINFPVVFPFNLMFVLSTTFLLLINLLVFQINQYNQKKSMEFTEMQLLLQKKSDLIKYHEMLLSQHENQSILIHDIKKHLQSVLLLNKQKEPEKIDSYIRQLIDSSDLRESVRICDNEMLNAILCQYKRQCDSYHIAFHTDIRSGSVQNISHRDLTSLFCNLLENAVTAATPIPNSYIELSVQKKKTAPILLIVLINSCRFSPDFNQNGMPVSNKTDNGRHGFGVRSIQKVVDQYHGNMRMYYDDATATFHTIITLKQE